MKFMKTVQRTWLQRIFSFTPWRATKRVRDLEAERQYRSLADLLRRATRIHTPAHLAPIRRAYVMPPQPAPAPAPRESIADDDLSSQSMLMALVMTSTRSRQLDAPAGASGVWEDTVAPVESSCTRADSEPAAQSETAESDSSSPSNED